MVIYKYYLTVGENFLNLMKGSKVIHVDAQHKSLCCWVLHPTKTTEYESVVVSIYGTGMEIPEHGRLKYLNTIL